MTYFGRHLICTGPTAFLLRRKKSEFICYLNCDIELAHNCALVKFIINEPPHDKTNKLTCASLGRGNEILVKQSWSHDKVTKMAAIIPYIVKTLKNLLPLNQKADGFCMQYRVLKYYQVCSNDDPGLTLTFLRQGQIWSLMLLYGKKEKTLFYFFYRNYFRLLFETSTR